MDSEFHAVLILQEHGNVERGMKRAPVVLGCATQKLGCTTSGTDFAAAHLHTCTAECTVGSDYCVPELHRCVHKLYPFRLGFNG